MKAFLSKLNLFKKYQKLPFRKKKTVVAYLFLLPWIIGIIVFFLPPVLDTFYGSFFDFTLDRSTGMRFVRFENFQIIFNPIGETIKVFGRSLVEILYTVPVVLVFSLFIAIILNTKFRGRGLVRTIFFMPLILGLNVVNIVLLNNPVNGMLENEMASYGSALSILSVNNVVGLIYASGLPIAFLDPIIASINSIFRIISFVGVQILLFLASLQSVNKSLYEVAKMEGANRYELFWKITFPMVLPAMRVVVTYTIIDAVLRSEIVQYINSAAMARYRQGTYAAASLVVVLGSFLLIFLFNAIIPKGGYEK